MKITNLIFVLLISFAMFLNAGDFAFVQKDSPLQIVGATTDMKVKDFYGRVIVVNVSTRQILRAQLGWIMADKDNEKRVFGVGYGPPVDLNLQPLDIATTGPQGATLSIVSEKAQAAGIPHVKLRLGVVYVKFEDGSEWKYPLDERKAFDQVDDPELVHKISPKVHEFREKNGQISKGPVRGSGRQASTSKGPVRGAASQASKTSAFQTPRPCPSTATSPKQSRSFMAWLSDLLSPPVYAGIPQFAAI